MKRFGFTSIISLTVLCFFLAACSEQKPPAEKASTEKAKVENLATTPEDIKKEASDLAKTTMAYTEEQKELYQKKIQEKMTEYSQKLVDLETKLVMLNEQAKAEMAEEMEDLKRKKGAMGEKIRELQTASGEAYEDLKEGLESAMVEMDEAYDQALSRFQK
jgi:DNA polymerase III delta prime subunit